MPPDLQADIDAVIRAASEEFDRGKAVQEVAAAIEEDAETPGEERLPVAGSSSS